MFRLVSLVVGLVLACSLAQAQINVVPVNGGTGALVSVPIPGGSGLSVTVGTGSAALPLQDIRTNPNAVNITTSDDGWTNVPLGFDFPFFGRTFNDSWAMTNGVVTFQDPMSSGAYGLCCEGVNLSTTTDPRYNWSIYGLHSDLYSWNGQNQYYLRDRNSMTYGWYDISQCCSSSGGNSFEIRINSSGLVDTRIAGATIQWNGVTSGMAGDLSQGQYYQYYHGQGINITPGSASIFSWQALNGTGGVDVCTINPLSSPTCAGYQAAYTTQQCTISALYDPSCPGYAVAYLEQQCSINPLHSNVCPGYAAAYLEQQCSINPLYSSTCSGYATAYFNQQCSLNGLYDQKCPNYSTAYATKMLLESQGTASAVATAGAVATTAPTTNTTTVNNDGSVSTPTVSTGNAAVDKAITPPTTSTTTAAAPAAPVQLVQPAPAPGPGPGSVTAAAPAPQEKKPESSPQQSQGQQQAQSGQSGQGSQGEKAQPTQRQQLAERRAEAARRDAVERGKNLASDMGKVADIETQKAIQNVVIQAMGYTPGFDTYSKTIIPDAVGYRPYAIYTNQVNVDNRRLGMSLYGPSDRLHNELVNSQYKGN